MRDEAANFLLSVCSDFDDSKSLLQIEDIKPRTKEEGEPVDEEFVVNFQKEPKKSQTQLQKLLRMLKANIMSHDEFLQMVRRLNPSQVPVREESVLKRIVGVSQRQVSVHEEIAHILVAIFGRKTSVVFDTSALCEIFAQTTAADKEMVAHTIFLSLAMIKQGAVGHEIFKKYLELATSQLKLSTLNEMI